MTGRKNNKSRWNNSGNRVSAPRKGKRLVPCYVPVKRKKAK